MVHLCYFSSSHAVQAIRQRRPIGAGQQVVGRGRQERQEEARVTEKEGNTGEEGFVDVVVIYGLMPGGAGQTLLSTAMD